MPKKEKFNYTAPLTGVEEQVESTEGSVHDALQTTWNTEQIIELNHCDQTKDEQ
ncbi:hypothetical protein [Halalkalibacter okhensis]|uniref:hypothetical protein n=1 Tax=Halalkalibacter okhensis TaxID=333138 RepID=UPI000A52BE07|nr:hypothetical protein [Halalkalibacter okhensis]